MTGARNEVTGPSCAKQQQHKQPANSWGTRQPGCCAAQLHAEDDANPGRRRCRACACHRRCRAMAGSLVGDSLAAL
jgi:hypothetical protein